MTEKNQPQLATITSVRELAVLMGVNYGKELSFVLRRLPPADRYFEFEIAKKNGKSRTIHAPIAILKKIQQNLLPLLEEIYEPPPAVHGYVKGRSIQSNASRHIGKRYILNIDITDLFPSIHFTRIYGILKSKRYNINPVIARAIAQICCHAGFLPVGAPTSGILSNIVCGPLDASLLRVAKAHRIQYTRYADDITMSASNAAAFRSATGINMDGAFIVRDQNSIGDGLRQIFTDNRFSINPNKVWAVHKNVRQSVTGIIVNKKQNVPIEFFRNLRATVRAIEKYTLEGAQDLYLKKYRKNTSARLDENLLGRLSYLGQITNYDNRYTRIAQRVRKILPGRPISIPALDVERAIYVAEELVEKNQATAFYVGSGYFITVAHLFDKSSDLRVASLTCPGYFDEPFTASVLHYDFEYDVALLKAPQAILDEGRPFIRMGQRQFQSGDVAKVMGFPQYNPGNTCSHIEVGVTGSRLTLGKRRTVVDKNLPHGLSGGPVFDSDGVCSGIVFSGAPLGSSDAPMSVSFTPFSLFAQLYSEWVQPAHIANA